MRKQNSENTSGIRILLVDDEALVRRVVRLMLESRGFLVEDAPNVEIAYQIFKDADCRFSSRKGCKPLAENCYFDVVLTDVQMPREDGFSFAKRLREECENVKFLFMSGSIQDIEEFADDGLELMRDKKSILEKPVQAAQLAEAIFAILEKPQSAAF